MPVRLSDSEFDRRREVIRAKMQERSPDALCVFLPAQVFYVTGFSFIATERPIGVIYRSEKDSALLFVPLLEGEHAEEPHVDLVHTYDEYPGKTHPMKHFVRLLVDLELEGSRIGVDADGYAGGYGYVGPRLSELINSEIIDAKDLIERLMWIKSDEEISLIRDSCKWGNLAHRLLQQYTAPGLAETDISFAHRTRCRFWTSATIRRSSQGWSSLSNREYTCRGSPASATPTRSSLPTSGLRS